MAENPAHNLFEFEHDTVANLPSLLFFGLNGAGEREVTNYQTNLHELIKKFYTPITGLQVSASYYPQ